jgi:hypothetical protein
MQDMRRTATSTDTGIVLKEMMFNTDWKITIQSTVLEGASRSIPYRYFSEGW